MVQSRDCTLSSIIDTRYDHRDRPPSVCTKAPLADHEPVQSEIETSAGTISFINSDHLLEKTRSCALADSVATIDSSTVRSEISCYDPPVNQTISSMSRNTPAFVAAAQEVLLTVTSLSEMATDNQAVALGLAKTTSDENGTSCGCSEAVDRDSSSPYHLDNPRGQLPTHTHFISQQPLSSPSFPSPSPAERLEAGGVSPTLTSSSTPSPTPLPSPRPTRQTQQPSIARGIVAVNDVTEQVVHEAPAAVHRPVALRDAVQCREGESPRRAREGVVLPGPNDSPPPYVAEQPRGSMRLPFYLTAIPSGPPPPYSLTDDIPETRTSAIRRQALSIQHQNRNSSEQEGAVCDKWHWCLCVSGCTVCVMFSFFTFFV